MVTLFKTSYCAYCPMTAKFLKHKGVEFKEIYIDDKPEVRADLYKQTGFMTVPVVTDGKEYVVGYNPGRLTQFINQL